jgi:hypothetical protein
MPVGLLDWFRRAPAPPVRRAAAAARPCDDGTAARYELGDGALPLCYTVAIDGGHRGGIVVDILDRGYRKSGPNRVADELEPAHTYTDATIDVALTVTRTGGDTAGPPTAVIDLFQKDGVARVNARCYRQQGAFDAHGQTQLFMSIAVVRAAAAAPVTP